MIKWRMLEAVVNVSEGRDHDVLDRLHKACGSALLDVHTDAFHHRSVFTIAGPDVFEATQRLVSAVLGLVDITTHSGVHPRIGAIDVIPFVPLEGSTIEDAIEVRDRFARWLGARGVPCFLYGPERSLPDVRHGAFTTLDSDTGPAVPHSRAGASAVGARTTLVAYNLWLAHDGVEVAKRIAKEIRRPGLRTLGLDVGGTAQVSCNITEPELIGPDVVHDLVAAQAEIRQAELVGLLPETVLQAVPRTRWDELDLAAEKTIEARLKSGGPQ